ncbi:DNA polymerase III subunit beta [Porphyromonas crevioricanis]|uniref:Beta sliding clamp n=1 Tax=Porphyromonas crevioricanis TaxID=393921 RepID=A0A0A2FUR6_9PORP|nr:DNA polymerase III subunit beta [Porphyromonas crevioricanis]KGN88743.1 DNA polymerase III subunit beta [Porphyromonas crevioricanis]KGN93887.1 DNA polymerase III subunit beta [Porphyromonas crevioricanis]GAD07670.1 DNA polymerase III beta subunit [Porphyromonas crevioricanis JCM 13913]SQH73641.1 DNA polymerase III subunit beta [Porphyromonas crevioricanis]
MKFEVSSSKMQQLLQAVSRVITPRVNIPILECVLFELKGNTLRLTGADPGTRLEGELEVNNLTGEDGSFAILQRVLLDPIKEMPEQPITFDVDLKTLNAQINYNSGQYTFVVKEADTYPRPLDDDETKQSLHISVGNLLKGINATLFATSNDDRRPIMTGVYMDIFQDKIVFVGSDGKMLVRQQNYEVKATEKMGFCLPKKVATLISRSLLQHEDNDDMIEMIYSEKFIQLRLPSYTLSGRLLEGRYPNYNSVIPTQWPLEVVVDRLLLLSAAKRVSVFASESANMLRFEFSPEGIKLSANDFDFSVSAEEMVKADCPADIDLKMGFESTVLQATLQAINSSEVKLCLTDQVRACVIVPCDSEESIDQASLILPMRLIGE